MIRAPTAPPLSAAPDVLPEQAVRSDEAQFTIVQSILVDPSFSEFQEEPVTFSPTRAKLTVPQTIFLAFFLQTMPYLFFSSPWVVPSHDNISKMTGVAFLQHWSFLPAPLGTPHLVLWAWSQEMGWKIFTLWFCNSCAVEVRGTQSCVPSSHSCCHAPDRPVLCIQGSWTFLSAQIYLLTGCSVDWLLIVALAHPGHAGALEWFQGHLAMAAFPRWLERSVRASLWCSACWC